MRDGKGRDVTVTVNREAFIKVSRAPECAKCVNDQSVDDMADAEDTSRGDRDTGHTVFGVGVTAARRGIEHVLQSTVLHDEEQVVFEVDVDGITRGCARVRDNPIVQRRDELRVDDSAAIETGRFLERIDRLLSRVSEVPVGYP